MKPYHPNTPWLLVGRNANGFAVLDKRDGARWEGLTQDQAHQIIADRSSSGSGLGDAIHRVTSALGFKRCAPCAKRQAALNAMIPRVPGFRGR
jgi:hypothetical protein